MRRSISVLLTTVLVFAATLPAAAQSQTAPTSFNPYVAKQPSTNQLNPFNLATLAYQGYFKDQGILSNGALLDAIASGTIAAQDIIQAAVKANRLSEQTLSDRGYRHHLEEQLQGFTAD
ncbi:hypothetical protein I8752_35520 [Nostocaceae cyanobacterium CENA369]|uniref:Uncharacterized protein n=1 Tax=Dendronalium phyllosphericum CENA369 TaxID=1725256 RepID=A0A8J7IM35_9NOST|nr:hypothetical protein [Dendronalium phyllosphericum]MBH8578166.1 hypothetical protein [Dendronalium phyllosphericum CENA369]